jgi:hypothetical protein
MKTYVIRPGDYLARVADRAGLTLDEVWNDPANKDLVALRKTPDVLLAGDIVRLQDPKPRSQRLTAKTSNPYTLKLRVVKLPAVFKSLGQPVANEAFEVHGVGKVTTGTTDGKGKATLEVTPLVEQVVVRFPARKLQFRMRVGFLDPATEPSGALQRLTNLGYAGERPRESLRRVLPPDAANGDARAELARALKAFQRDYGLPVTGALDAATSDKLLAVNGS